MSSFQPPPTYADVVVEDAKTKKQTFNPIWLKWFIDIAAFITNNGGGSSSAIQHNSLSGLQGGQASQYYHQTALQNARKIKWKDADDTRTNTTTLADDSELIFPVSANEKWVGRCFIDLGAGLTTTGIKITIAAPTGASGNIHAGIMTDATSGKVNPIMNTNTIGAALDFTAATFPASVTVGMLEIEFRVANGANAGNISLQWAQSTSSGTALTLGAGSQMVADRVA